LGDLSLIVMAADNPVPESPGRWRRGEIVDVIDRIIGGTPHPRFFHIYITGYPDAIGFRAIKDRLVQLHDYDERTGEFTAKRNVVIDYDAMPPGQRNQLFRDREMTITFGAAKSYARKRLGGDLTLGDSIDDSDFDTAP
jgi:hypothetical protein